MTRSLVDDARAYLLSTLAGASLLLGGCTTPPVKDAPQPSASSSTPAPPATATATAAASADAAPVASADTGPAPLSTDSWATLANAKKTLAVKYPADVFTKTKVTGEALLLQSELKRGLLGEGNGNKVHRYEIEIDQVAGTPFEVLKKKFKAYPFPQMFPTGAEGSYIPAEGEGVRVELGGRAGYRVHTGVEGYNEDTVLLEAEGKKTLRFRCTYVGSVMGPEIDDVKQVAICDAVLASALAPKAP